MGRFTKISKVDTPYIPVDLDLSKPKMLMYNQLKDEEKQNLKVAEQDSLAKLEYSKLLSKVRPEDYPKAKQLFDNYLNDRTNQIINSKDNLSLSQAMNSSSSFLANPEFQKMTSDYEAKQNAIQQARELEAQGKTSVLSNNSILDQSGYDKQGDRRDYTTIGADGKPVKTSIDQLRASELTDYQDAIADFGRKVAHSDGWDISKVDANGYIQNMSGDILTPQKLQNIADKTFESYINSGDGKGKAQLAFLTTPSDRNPTPLTQDEALAKMKSQYSNVLKSLAYSKTKSSETPSNISDDILKGRQAKAQQQTKVPVYTSPNTSATGNSFIDSKASVVTGLVSGNKPNKPIDTTIDNGYILGDRRLFGQYGSPIKKPIQFKGTLEGYETKFVIDQVEKNGKVDQHQTSELRNHLATTGNDGTLSDADLETKPEIDKQTGSPYIQHNGYKFFLKERAFAKLVSEDQKETIYKPITRGESNAFLNKNYTDTTPIDFKPVNTQNGVAYKANFEQTPDIQNKMDRAIVFINENKIFNKEEASGFTDFIKKNNMLVDTSAKRQAFEKINSVIEQMEKEETLENFNKKKDQETFQIDYEN